METFCVHIKIDSQKPFHVYFVICLQMTSFAECSRLRFARSFWRGVKNLQLILIAKCVQTQKRSLNFKFPPVNPQIEHVENK